MIFDAPPRRFHGRLRLIVLGLLVAAIAAACSMVSLGYRSVPALLTYRIDQWFALDDAQSALVKARVEALYAWHRREALAPLVRDIDEAQSRLARPLTSVDADWLVGQAQTHYRAAASRIIGDSADLLVALRPEQLAHLNTYFTKRNREFAEKYIDPEPDAIHKARLERVASLAQDWLGPLSGAQRERLRARLAAIPADYPAVLSERERRQGELLSILRSATEARADSRSPGVAVRQGVDGLERWALDWESGRSQSYGAHGEKWLRGYKALYVELINDASPEQREHLRERLRYYSRELAAFVQPEKARAESCENCEPPRHPG